MVGTKIGDFLHDRGDLGVIHNPQGGDSRFQSAARSFTIRRVESLTGIRITAADQHGLVTSAQCRAAGISPQTVQRLCRSGEWQRLNRAVYLVDADRYDLIPSVTMTRAAVLSAGPHAVAVLETAAEVLGIAGVHHAGRVHVSLPSALARPRRPTEPNVRLHQLSLPAADIVVVSGLRVTTPARTVADLMRRSDRLTAVSIVDSALYRRVLGPDDLDRVVAHMAGRPGAPRARPWLADVDGRAESPLETRVRLRAADGGVAPDELQFRVRDSRGRIVAIGDLAWIRARVIAEADGVEAHDNPVAVFRDRKRQNDVVNAGFRLLRFTWEDTRNPDYIPHVVRDALSRTPAPQLS
jgi:very-short-patch-repair endonuclease